jgi:hypothetical protein
MTAHRTRIVLLILVTLGLGLVQTASAAPPPPPPFYNFEIINETGQDVADVDVELYPTVAPGHTQFGPAIKLTMSSLPEGAKIQVHLPNTYGIAKIKANAHCPQPLAQDAEIVAGMHNGRYCGFAYDLPTPPGDFKPKLIFRKKASDPNRREAFLEGKYWWGGNSPVGYVSDTKTFP